MMPTNNEKKANIPTKYMGMHFSPENVFGLIDVVIVILFGDRNIFIEPTTFQSGRAASYNEEASSLTPMQIFRHLAVELYVDLPRTVATWIIN